MEIWNKKCREFNGLYPCDELKYSDIENCTECKYPRLYGERVLIIKLGAKGDVVRSLSVLKPIIKRHDKPHITWLVEEKNKGILQGQKIDRILTLSRDDLLRLDIEEFDHVYNLEYDLPATALVHTVKGKHRYGFYLDSLGLPAAFDERGQYFLDIAFSDKHNIKNKKTYQKMIFDALGLEYNRDSYKLKIDKKYKQDFMLSKGILESERVIGLNLGTAARWPSKAWHKDAIVEFIKKCPYKVLVLGGPHEKALLQEVVSLTGAITNNPDNSDIEFVSVVDICDTVITGDSFALHVAVGRGKKTVGLFFCTSHAEVEDYDLVTKLISPLLIQNYYTEENKEKLRKSVSVEQVLEAIK